MRNQAGLIWERLASSAAGVRSYWRLAQQRGLASNGFRFAVLPTFQESDAFLFRLQSDCDVTHNSRRFLGKLSGVNAYLRLSRPTNFELARRGITESSCWRGPVQRFKVCLRHNRNAETRSSVAQSR